MPCSVGMVVYHHSVQMWEWIIFKVSVNSTCTSSVLCVLLCLIFCICELGGVRERHGKGGGSLNYLWIHSKISYTGWRIIITSARRNSFLNKEDSALK
jgi:hypothetical protein